MTTLFLRCAAAPAATGDRLLRTLRRTRVRTRALPAARQITSMTLPTVTADFHKPLDTHLNLAAKIAFDRKVLRDILAEEIFIRIREIANANVRADARFRDNSLGAGQANPVNIG